MPFYNDLRPKADYEKRSKTIQSIGELDEYEEHNIAKGLSWLEKQNKDLSKISLYKGEIETNLGTGYLFELVRDSECISH